jgi:hypothetical protein
MTKKIFNNKIETPTWEKKHIIEHVTNTPSLTSNNIPCILINIGTDLNNPDIKCASGIVGNKMQNYVTSTNPQNSTNPLVTKTTLSSLPLNNNTSLPGPITTMSPILQSDSKIIMTDTNFINYTIIPILDGSIPTQDPITNPICTFINTGSVSNPSLHCQEQLSPTANVTTLDPILPAGCLIQNTGTQTNPILSCASIYSIPTSEPVVSVKGASGTNSGVSSQINVMPISSGTQSSGTLLQIQQSINPYNQTIQNLNQSIMQNPSWSCPAGYIAQYPNQTLTECNASGNCTDYYQDPAVLKQPCMGPADSNYKYNNDLYGVLDLNADIKCQYGFPIFSGINNNGKFNGNVMCLYQKGLGQIL